MRPLPYVSLFLLIGPVPAVSAAGATVEVKTGKAAFGDWISDALGISRHFQLADPPPPELVASGPQFHQARERAQ